MFKNVTRCVLAIVVCFAVQTHTVAQDADIVDTAVGAGSFNTLVAAVKAADLVDVLKSDGPFTVFAPTDEAFAKLPQGTVESLLLPENKSKLAAILTYHVVPAKVTASQVVQLTEAKSVQGGNIAVTVANGKVKVNNANVVKTDILCTNGVIHVIDSVILPPTKPAVNAPQADIVDTAVGAGSFKTLVAAVKAAGLVETLKGPGPFTVLAPTDEAFAKLPKGTVESLLKPENKDKLVSILTYHVIPGAAYAKDVVKLREAATVQGSKVMINASSNGVMINNAKVVKTDIACSNGVIHVIDSVIMPPDATKTSAGSLDPRALIERCVSTGAPLFNAGNHTECCNLYSGTIRMLLNDGGTMPANVRNQLQSAMDTASNTHNMSERAWAYRRGLDSAHGMLSR